MAYDGVRSYIGPISIAAQNIVATASAVVATSTATSWMPIAEASFICSIAGVVTATPSGPPATVKYYVLYGTTTVGSVTITQAVGSSAMSTVSPSVAVSSGGALTLLCVATGTASATETAAACNLIVGLAPQFV